MLRQTTLVHILLAVQKFSFHICNSSSVWPVALASIWGQTCDSVYSGYACTAAVWGHFVVKSDIHVFSDRERVFVSFVSAMRVFSVLRECRQSSSSHWHCSRRCCCHRRRRCCLCCYWCCWVYVHIVLLSHHILLLFFVQLYFLFDDDADSFSEQY